MTSAAWPVDKAVASAIIASPALELLLAGGKVYSMLAPQGAELDYVVLGDTSETGAHSFGRRGSSTALTMHVWSKDLHTKEGVLTIYAALRTLLDGARLVLDGHEWLLGGVQLVSVFSDLDAKATHGVAILTVRSYVGAR